MVDLETTVKGGDMKLDLSPGQRCTYYVRLQTSGRVWTDQWQRRNASSLGWLAVQLLRCNGKSAGAGRLIDDNKTMLFLRRND
jgi:hypothetical protein